MDSPTRQQIRDAARILKSKGSTKIERKAAAAVLGSLGSSKGGHNRARNLTPERRTEIARQGGLSRQQIARETRAKREARAQARRARRTTSQQTPGA